MGIRSFDNNHSETIKFFKPLTLIVGSNGSGKTTIIESLKYLTTGDLPPNSRGGAFIHDPKLCGEKEVLAVAIMSFHNTQGKKMTCSRRIQLTVKKTTMSQKALEGQLVLYGNGNERTAISSRVGELDQMLPMYLGVSRSILDNVIFCHQDESLWPMSEPSVLKKKFDEIFEAMKYTKAVDNIKVLRKKYHQDLEKLKIEETNAKEEKSRGEMSEKRQTKLDSDIERMRQEISSFEPQLREAQQKQEHAADTAGGFSEIVNSLHGKRTEARIKEQNVLDLKGRITLMQNSDYELDSMLESYQERVDQYAHELNSKKQQYHDLDAELKSSRRTIEQKESEKGRLQAEKDQYDRKIQRREAEVKEAANDHGIRGFDQDLDDVQVRQFMDRIAKLAKDQRSAIERAQRDAREESQRVQTVLDTLHQKQTMLITNKENAKKSMTQNEGKIRDLRQRANEVDVDEGRRAVLQSAVADTEARLNNSKEVLHGKNWDEQIADAEARIQSRERVIERLQAELEQAHKHTTEAARSDYLKKGLKDTKLKLETMQGAHKDSLQSALGVTWDPGNVASLYEEAQATLISGLHRAEKQRDATSRELELTGGKLKQARKDVKEKKQELNDCARQVQEKVELDDPSGFPEALQQLEQDYEEVMTGSSNNAALKQYYEGCKQALDSRNICQLCNRAFKSDSEKSYIRKKIHDNLKKAMEYLQEQNKDDYEADLATFKEAKPSYDRWILICDVELPKSQAEVDRLEPYHCELLKKIEGEDEAVNERTSAKADLEQWAKTVKDITEYISNVRKFESELEELTQKQSEAGFTRSTDELHSDMRAENDQQKTARAAFDRLKGDRDAASKSVDRLEIELRDARSNLNGVAQQLRDKASYQEQLDDLKGHNESQRANLASINDDLGRLEPELNQTKLKLDDVGSRGNEKEQALQEQMRDLDNTLSKLERASTEINAYQERNGPNELVQCQRQLQSARDNHTMLDTDLRQLTASINKLSEASTTHKQTRHQIEDNIRYRRDLRSLDGVRSEIRELESHNAEADRERWNREAQKWSNKRNELSAEVAGLHGELKSKDQELQHAMEEWETLYKGADRRYREAHVKVEAYKAAVEDLGRYGGALDKAIMRYHALKMDEINEIVDDLWRRTYQGTDVDTVLIRSDSDGPTRAGNKSYNYRVCMVKQDAEMDMRGRCSAGQKVLASIIIRLALAECFGANCGVMALDEPTTNLDRENIRALASSLHTIIKARAGTQRNFQLIVITHDEEFLRDMRATDFCDNYWRISRNRWQKSLIEEKSIHEVV